MDRSKKPAAIGVGASLPQPTISIQDNAISATLPSGESVTIQLYGATVTSWKANGQEQLFVSQKAHLDGSKPIRGGIPLVFPVRLRPFVSLEAMYKLTQPS
jgi:glucose-6-phosphate 1-epimerase